MFGCQIDYRSARAAWDHTRYWLYLQCMYSKCWRRIWWGSETRAPQTISTFTRYYFKLLSRSRHSRLQTNNKTGHTWTMMVSCARKLRCAQKGVNYYSSLCVCQKTCDTAPLSPQDLVSGTCRPVTRDSCAGRDETRDMCDSGSLVTAVTEHPPISGATYYPGFKGSFNLLITIFVIWIGAHRFAASHQVTCTCIFHYSF